MPSSITLPSEITRMRSAVRTVLRRCAMMKLVRPSSVVCDGVLDASARFRCRRSWSPRPARRSPGWPAARGQRRSAASARWTGGCRPRPRRCRSPFPSARMKSSASTMRAACFDLLVRGVQAAVSGCFRGWCRKTGAAAAAHSPGAIAATAGCARGSPRRRSECGPRSARKSGRSRFTMVDLPLPVSPTSAMVCAGLHAQIEIVQHFLAAACIGTKRFQIRYRPWMGGQFSRLGSKLSPYMARRLRAYRRFPVRFPAW